jgi:hypothetical protein
MSYYLGLSILSNNPGKNPLNAEARRILSELANRPIAENDITREKQGRPFFTNRDIQGKASDFNISHSGAIAAVSLVNGRGIRTGCDIELIRKRTRAREIAEEFFSIPERGYINFQDRFDEKRFYEIWTLKECFIKLRGLSVFDMAGIPSFIREGVFFFDTSVSSPLTFYLYELNNAGERYILATAIEGIEAEPEIHWFSPVTPVAGASLPCISIAKIKAALNPAETVSPKT